MCEEMQMADKYMKRFSILIWKMQIKEDSIVIITHQSEKCDDNYWQGCRHLVSSYSITKNVRCFNHLRTQFGIFNKF